jgi:predicted enzyme related to lactoylglutathione lyase
MHVEFTLDCLDLDRVANFWRDAAGFGVDGRIERRYVSMSGHGVSLTLQAVEEPKAVKNRMHLDLLVDDVDREVERLEGLGATRLIEQAHEEFGQRWFVMADPEGNEFCVGREGARTRPPEAGQEQG